MSTRFCLLLSLLLPLSAHGQALVDARLVEGDFLEMEPIPAVVVLENRGAIPLRGGEDFQLAFEVTDRRGVRVALRGEAQPLLPDVIEPGATVAVTNDLNFLYRLDAHGQHGVVVRLQARKKTLVSDKLLFDILPGAELASVEGADADGSERIYTLRQISRNKQMILFLRVDDPGASLCYGVYNLGRYVPMRPPQIQVDVNHLVHVLHLTAPNQFLHSVFSPGGELVAQQVHAGDATVVRLEVDPEAGYRVIGTGVSEPKDRMLDSLPRRRTL